MTLDLSKLEKLEQSPGSGISDLLRNYSHVRRALRIALEGLEEARETLDYEGLSSGDATHAIAKALEAL